MWQLLLPLALGLGTMGLGRAELTTAQHRGLQVALEEFHKHPPVLWAFQVTSVDNAADTVSASPERGGWGRGSGDQNVPPTESRCTDTWAPASRPALQRGHRPPPQGVLLPAGEQGQVTPATALPAQLGCGLSLVCWQLFPAGQFVRLEFKLQQTSCRKKDWRKEDCKVKPNGVS